MTASFNIPTDSGTFVAHFSEHGLAALDFPNCSQPATARTSAPATPKLQQWLTETTAALVCILSGKKPGKLPPFDWSGATPFQQSVWRELLKIPGGKTKSYGEVAAVIGRPKSVRAVGGACGANPVPVLVPCHRVLAANGKLGGFSGGLDWKKRLLIAEDALEGPKAVEGELQLSP